MQRDLKPFLFLLFILLLTVPVYGTEIPVQVGTSTYGTFAAFVPEDTSFRSPQIHDMTVSPTGVVLFATSGGLAFYNGSWSIWHQDLSETNTTKTLLQDTIFSLEYDSVGRLWIGYGNGIQVWNGKSFIPIDDPNILIDRQILSLQRWNSTIWIATGHSGIHRYDDATGWTWYQPFQKSGANFYEVDAMAIDPVSNTLFLDTLRNGLWQVTGDPSGNVGFVSLTEPKSPYYSMNGVKSDPLGGVYYFNSNQVVHYTPETGFTPVLSGADLARPIIPEIHDIEPLPDAVLAVATDKGIYLWQDNSPVDHIYGFAAAGAGSDDIDSLLLDPSGRLWFEGQGIIGYYISDRTKAPEITIESPAPTIAWQIQSIETTESPTSVAPQTIQTVSTGSSTNETSILDSILGFFGNFGKLFGNLIPSGSGTS